MLFSIIVVCVITSCEKSNEIKNHHENSKVSLRSYDNESLDSLINAKYDLTIHHINDNVVKVVSDEGRYLTITTHENEIKIQGSMINYQTFTFPEENFKNFSLSNTMSNSNYFLGSDVLITDLVESFYNTSNLSETEIQAMKPCDEHPNNEAFHDCFDREYDEFCDDFLSCFYRELNKPFVVLIIAIHCARC